MAKLVKSYRISAEVDVLLKAEAARLTAANSGTPRVSEADVIELAVVRYLSEPTGGMGPLDGWEVPVAERIAAARAVVNEVEAAPAKPVAPVNKRTETVAQRQARESREHADELAESDVLAKMTGRTDIEYDLENAAHRSVIQPVANVIRREKPDYVIQDRKVKPLSRPHGATEPKRRREQ